MFSSRVLSWSNGGHVVCSACWDSTPPTTCRSSQPDWLKLHDMQFHQFMNAWIRSDQIRSIPHRQALCLCVSRRDGSRCWKEKAPFVDFTFTRPSSSAPSGPIPASYSVARAEATDTYCPGSTNLKSDMATIIHDINALLRASQGRSMSRL